MESDEGFRVASRSVHLYLPWGHLIFDARNISSTTPTGIAEVVLIQREPQTGPLPGLWVGREAEIDVEHKCFQILEERLF